MIDDKDNIVIIDFGLSIKFNDNDLLNTPCGSPCYCSPEMIN
jgi:serine/threonine protein kinase